VPLQVGNVEAMTDRLFAMQLNVVPYSSVVGQSLTITHGKLGTVAQLIISVPQPHLDYKTIALAVVDALKRGHVSDNGVTLILPENIIRDAQEHLRKQP